jgi:hypothetical protein
MTHEPSEEEVRELARKVDEQLDAVLPPPLTQEQKRSLQMYELDELSAELRRLEGEGN